MRVSDDMANPAKLAALRVDHFADLLADGWRAGP